MSRLRLAALVGTVLLALAACGPSQEERRAVVDETWRQTVAVSDGAVDALIALRPDLALAEVDGGSTGESFIDCSGSTVGNAVSPTEIRWSSLRDVGVEPAQETASLADSLADRLVGEGWLEGRNSDQGDGHLNSLYRGHYSIRITSDAVVPDSGQPTVRIIVYSPCVPAPERMIDWTPPTVAPTATPSPTGSSS